MKHKKHKKYLTEFPISFQSRISMKIWKHINFQQTKVGCARTIKMIIPNS